MEARHSTLPNYEAYLNPPPPSLNTFVCGAGTERRSLARSRNRAAYDERKLAKQSGRTFSKHIFSLFDNSVHSDLLIKCVDKRWHCHSVILLARTPRLHSVLLSRFQVRPTRDISSDYSSSDNLTEQLQVQLPARLIRSFDFDLFLRCLYSGQDVNAEQTQLLDLLRICPQPESDSAATSDPLLDLLEQQSQLTISMEPLYANLLEVNGGCDSAMIDDGHLQTEPELIDKLQSLSPKPTPDSSSQTLLIQLAGGDGDKQPNAIVTQDDHENHASDMKAAKIDALAQKAEGSQNSSDTKQTGQQASRNLSSDETQPVDDLNIIKCAVQQQTRETLDLANQSKQLKQPPVLSGHTMSDVSELTDDLPSAQQIVNRMLNQDDDLKRGFDSSRYDCLGDSQDNDLIMMERINRLEDDSYDALGSDDVSESGNLLDKLNAIEQEKEDWRLQLEMNNQANDANDVRPCANIFRAAGSIEDDDRTMLNSPMVRSGTFDLLCHNKDKSIRRKAANLGTNLELNTEADSNSAYSGDPLLGPAVVESANDDAFARCLHELDEHTVDQTLVLDSSQNYHLIPAEQKKRKVSDRIATGRRRRSLSSSGDNASDGEMLQRRTYHQNQQFGHNSATFGALETESSDGKAAGGHQGKGFMFISMDSNHHSMHSAKVSTYAGKGSKHSTGTFERARGKRSSRECSNEGTICVECGSSNGCGSDCEQRRLLQDSLLSCTKLGEDLLWLFLLQTHCDVRITMDEGQRALGAHRCILAARSEYLRAQLAHLSNRSRSDDCSNVTTDTTADGFSNCSTNHSPIRKPSPPIIRCLAEYSFPVVHFALCHIYSGTVILPNFVRNGNNNSGALDSSYGNVVDSDIIAKASTGNAATQNALPYSSVPLAELLDLCELLQLPHLMQAVIAGVRHHLCHQFHSPCGRCLPGILQALKLADRCDLAPLRDSCLRWLACNFPAICTEKLLDDVMHNTISRNRSSRKHSQMLDRQQQQACSSLDRVGTGTGWKGLCDRILSTIFENLKISTALEFGIGCELALDTAIRAGRGPALLEMIRGAMQIVKEYVAEHLDELLLHASFDQLLRQHIWQVDPLQQLLDGAIDQFPKCEVACRTLPLVDGIISANESSPNQAWVLEERAMQLLRHLRRRLERLLVQRANEAVYCPSWQLLSPGLQRHIKSTAVLVFEFEKPLAKRPLLTSSMRKSSSAKSPQASACDEKQHQQQQSVIYENATSERYRGTSSRSRQGSTPGKVVCDVKDKCAQARTRSAVKHSAEKEPSLVTASPAKHKPKNGDRVANELASLDKTQQEIHQLNDQLSKLEFEQQVADEDDGDAHIYDEVPIELVHQLQDQQQQQKHALPANTIGTSSYGRIDVHAGELASVDDAGHYQISTSQSATIAGAGQRQSQIAKVTPFTMKEKVKQSASPVDNVYENVDELLSSSNHASQHNHSKDSLDKVPVASLLREADQLQQKLSRKLSEAESTTASGYSATVGSIILTSTASSFNTAGTTVASRVSSGSSSQRSSNINNTSRKSSKTITSSHSQRSNGKCKTGSINRRPPFK